MTHQATEITRDLTTLSNSKYWKYFGYTIIYQLFIMLLALIQYEGGIYKGGIRQFFQKVFWSGYLASDARQSYVNDILVFELISISMIFFAIFFRENHILKNWLFQLCVNLILHKDDLLTKAEWKEGCLPPGVALCNSCSEHLPASF